jgi:hypothetical protein
VQDGTQPVGPLGGVGRAERYVRVLDPLFGAADALGHGRLGHQERAGDFGGGQPADGPQRQRNGRRGWQRGMAAQEQQEQ